MNTILKTALAAAAVTLSMPALAYTVYPDVDFEWYANVGRQSAAPPIAPQPAPRAGYIWAPSHWETRNAGQVFVAAHWIRDDFYEQVALAYTGTGVYSTAPLILIDKDGNIIPTNPEAYPVGSISSR